jgi:hypothetical protein
MYRLFDGTIILLLCFLHSVDSVIYQGAHQWLSMLQYLGYQIVLDCGLIVGCARGIQWKLKIQDWPTVVCTIIVQR